MKIPVQIQMTTGENGQTALSMMLAGFGRYVPMQELREVCVTSRNGSSPRQIAAAAEHYGLKAQIVELDMDALRQQKLPVMILWKKRYYTIVTGFSNDLVSLIDPSKGSYRCELSTFQKRYSGTAILLEKGPDFQPGGTRDSVFSLLKERVSSLIRPMFGLLILSVICIWLDIAFSYGQKTFMDNVVNEKGDLSVFAPITSLFGMEASTRYTAANIMIVLMMGIILLDAFFTILNETLIKFVTRMKLAESQSDLFIHIIAQPLRFFEQYSTGEMLQRMNGNEKLWNTLVSSLVPRMINVFMMVFYFVMLLRYNRTITLICITLEVIHSLIELRLQERTAIIARATATSTGQLNSSVLNGMNMIDTIKSTGAEKSFFNMWYRSQSEVTEAQTENFRLNQIIRAYSNIHSYLLSAVQMFLGAYFIKQGQFTLGTLTLFRSILGQMRNSLNACLSSMNTLQTMRTNIERVDDICTRPVRDEIPLEDGIMYDKLPGEISVSHVCYRYNNGDDLAINDVSLDVHPGQMVAIVGSTGCGKSTLLKLMADLYEPESGEILYSGKKRSEIPDVVFHSSIVTVDQETVMFEDSVYSNIRLWDSTIEDYEIILAARDAQIHNRIIRDPHGYGAQVLENGANFSGGELQRFELARALAHEPTVLFLDEFTSALDAQTENRVIQAIRDKGTTCVIVAHRLSTIVDCDCIYVMDHGKIVQQGTHQELYQQEGLYRTLIGSQ
ncbi:MAG: ATP-binding cassette domain-containing protein [Solobacterium sp.]|nr:ATP-binding cassette domain-containing protein [Solobacterium sp.]